MNVSVQMPKGLIPYQNGPGVYARHTILVDRVNIVVAPIRNTRGFTACQKQAQSVGDV
jgi:hypothetical protein